VIVDICPWLFIRKPLPDKDYTLFYLANLILSAGKSGYICDTKKNDTMNKGDLITKISEDAAISRTQANAAIDSFVDAVTKSLKSGGKVTLVGFGTFSVGKRSARVGRNPQTGETIKIKAKKVAKFKAGKELSEKI
jgi:DNA-binding protein HU-beta